MPNHCENYLTIKGDHKYRQEFVDKNCGFGYGDIEKTGEYLGLSFHAQVPLPKRIVEAHEKDSSNDEWYKWCLDKWGTKWEAWDCLLDHDADSTVYFFTTAWSPPGDWMERVSKKFPHVTLVNSWSEEGGEGGYVHVEKGKTIYERAKTPEELAEAQGLTEEEYEELLEEEIL